MEKGARNQCYRHTWSNVLKLRRPIGRRRFEHYSRLRSYLPERAPATADEAAGRQIRLPGRWLSLRRPARREVRAIFQKFAATARITRFEPTCRCRTEPTETLQVM